MGRRKNLWSYKTYQRFLRNGRGTGYLDNYKPWITIHDFPSKGKVVRILGKKTNRIHHLMSQLEKSFFMILDNDPLVEDIREQFPLNLAESQLISAQLGIKHPEVNGFPYVMTTDFMVKRDGVWHAVQIKPSVELKNKRIMEKFEIEKAYYEQLKIDWRIVTEKDLSLAVSENYYWLNSGESLDHLVSNHDLRQKMRAAFLELYHNITVPFHTILKEMDDQCHVRAGTTMQLFKSCILDGDIMINLFEHINMDEPRFTVQDNGGKYYVW